MIPSDLWKIERTPHYSKMAVMRGFSIVQRKQPQLLHTENAAEIGFLTSYTKSLISTNSCPVPTAAA